MYARMMRQEDATKNSPFNPLARMSDWNFICDHAFDDCWRCKFCGVRVPDERR